MNKQLTLIIGIITLIGLVSATSSGGCIEIDLSEIDSQDIFWTTIGNSSDINGMNITLNETTKNASVYFVENYLPDKFTLIFFAGITKEVRKEVNVGSSGGGGGSSKTVYVQNKTFVEVDNYITKEVIIEKEVKRDTPYIEAEEPKQDIKWFKLFSAILILSVIAGSIIMLFIWAYNSYKTKQEYTENITTTEG